MDSTLPTITTPLRPDPSSQVNYNEIGAILSQARQALDRIVREVGELDGLEMTARVTEEYDNSPDTAFEAQATLLEVLDEEVKALKRWLEELHDLVQGALEDSTNIASTTITKTGVVDEKRHQEWALPGSRARYMVVVLLLSASLLATLFALFFVSTQK
ncbi:hypothetical protein KCU76_g5504, partial [Aureobasidium melanogenum]